MGRVKIRDQYSAEHWVDESSLAYAPWRDCEVIEREPEPNAEPESAVPAERPATDDKPTSPPASPADDKRRPAGDPKPPAQAPKPAAE